MQNIENNERKINFKEVKQLNKIKSIKIVKNKRLDIVFNFKKYNKLII